ncbi:hypothetical protein ACS0TY_012135 [Phlomoides rotata]
MDGTNYLYWKSKMRMFINLLMRVLGEVFLQVEIHLELKQMMTMKFKSKNS